jgi:hypothetical protein
MAWDSGIWDQESVIISVLDGVIMPSFAWIYSCNQFLRRVHVIAFYWD